MGSGKEDGNLSEITMTQNFLCVLCLNHQVLTARVWTDTQKATFYFENLHLSPRHSYLKVFAA